MESERACFGGEVARAGIILLDTKSRILLVQSKRTGKWGFTKGHEETFDINLLETATREVKEESGYLEWIHYKITSGPIYLRCRPYWTAVLNTNEPPQLNRGEKDHSGIGWFTIKQIRHLKLNEDVKLWLIQAAFPGLPA